MSEFLKSFADAFRGLKTVWKEERNFRIDVLAALAVLFCIFYFNFSFIESALVILAVVIVLSAEIVNTALEDLCDKVEPGQDKLIGKIKDIMAAYVLVSALGAAFIGALVFSHHFLPGLF